MAVELNAGGGDANNADVAVQNLRVVWVYEFHNTTELGRAAAMAAASNANGLIVRMYRSDWSNFSKWYDDLQIKLPIGVSLLDAPNDLVVRSVPYSVSMLWSMSPGMRYDSEVVTEDVSRLGATHKALQRKSADSTFYVSVPKVLRSDDRKYVPEIARAISIAKAVPVISGTTKDASPAHGPLVLCSSVSPARRMAVTCSPYAADTKGLIMSGVTDFLFTIQPNMTAAEMQGFVQSVHNS